MIRLPWVSRAHHVEAVALCQRLADAEHENAQILRHENAALLARYHSLKQQGFAEALPPREAPKVDPVKRAIAQKAGKNRALREQMEAQAAQDRILGVSDDVIIAQIQSGIDGTSITEAGLVSS